MVDYNFLLAEEQDLIEIALLRNKIRSNLTHDTSVIDPAKQLHWFRNVKKPEDLLYVLKEFDAIIGYGFIQFIDSRPWLTGAVSPFNQGKGYGELVFTQMINNLQKNHPEIYLDVLKSNFKAVNLYFKLGFKIVDQEDSLYIMRLNSNA